MTDQPVRPWARIYTLVLLFLVYMTSVADRQILAILTPAIQKDFALSDTGMGLLSGFTFAIFYATLGIPIAMWADRSSRRNILALCLAIWSVMTALSGLAQNFWQLALARIGVGIGEAGGGPPSHSMISDLFPPHQRARALSVFSLGAAFGLVLGLLLGSQIAQAHGWRTAFFALGLPGLILAVIVLTTVKEPARGRTDGGQAPAKPPAFFDVLRFMWGQRSLRHILIGAPLLTMIATASAQWLPSFLVRSHGMDLTQVGTYLALTFGVAGGLGTLTGGFLSDYLSRRDVRWGSWMIAGMSLVTVPFSLGIGLIDQTTVVLILVPIAWFISNLYLGPTLAMMQTLVAPAMRAVAASILLLAASLIGAGLGPLLAGVLSDLLTTRFGADALRYALMILCIFNVWGALHYVLAARTLTVDYARARDGQA